MGWGKGESIIERRREQIAVDPKATIRALQDDLRQKDLKPRERVRLLGLLAACYKHTGDRERVKAALSEARSVPRAGKIARLELMCQETTTLIEWAAQGKENWDTARTIAVAFLQETMALPRKSPKTAWGRRQERNRCGLRVTSFLARGQIDLFTGEVDSALSYALRALEELPAFPKAGSVPVFVERLTRGVVSLLANTLVRGGSGVTLDRGAEMIGDLISGLPRTDRLWRSTLSALLGCVAARKGDYDEAARIFERSLDTLFSIDADGAYELVLKMWKWSVEHMEEHAKRVEEYLERQRVKLPPLG